MSTLVHYTCTATYRQRGNATKTHCDHVNNLVYNLVIVVAKKMMEKLVADGSHFSCKYIIFSTPSLAHVLFMW